MPPKIILKWPQTKKNVATAHPECWVFHAMPHPPPCTWAHPRGQSLQLFYLSLCTMSFETNKNQKYNDIYTLNSLLEPCEAPTVGLRLRGHPSQTPLHVPQTLPPLVTLGHVGCLSASPMTTS